MDITAADVSLIAVAIVTAFVGIWRYLKTEAGKDKGKTTPTTDSGTVLAASFIDNRVLRDLIEALRVHMEEYSRETRKMNRNRQELTTAMEESTDAILANTDATTNMMRFMKRQGPRSAVDTSDES